MQFLLNLIIISSFLLIILASNKKDIIEYDEYSSIDDLLLERPGPLIMYNFGRGKLYYAFWDKRPNGLTVVFEGCDKESIWTFVRSNFGNQFVSLMVETDMSETFARARDLHSYCRAINYSKMKKYGSDCTIMAIEDDELVTYRCDFGWAVPTLYADNLMIGRLILQKKAALGIETDRGEELGISSGESTLIDLQGSMTLVLVQRSWISLTDCMRLALVTKSFYNSLRPRNIVTKDLFSPTFRFNFLHLMYHPLTGIPTMIDSLLTLRYLDIPLSRRFMLLRVCIESDSLQYLRCLEKSLAKMTHPILIAKFLIYLLEKEYDKILPEVMKTIHGVWLTKDGKVISPNERQNTETNRQKYYEQLRNLVLNTTTQEHLKKKRKPILPYIAAAMLNTSTYSNPLINEALQVLLAANERGTESLYNVLLNNNPDILLMNFRIIKNSLKRNIIVKLPPNTQDVLLFPMTYKTQGLSHDQQLI